MKNDTRLQTLLDVGISNSPQKTALHFNNRSYTYLELHQLSRKLAAGLQHNGVAEGDRVAIFLPNCPEAVMVFFASYMIGAVVVPLNYRYLVDEARYVLEQTEAKIMLFHIDKTEIINDLQTIFSPQTLYQLSDSEDDSSYRQVDELFDYPALHDYHELAEDHPAFILYTSGSTGKPKGVTHSHHGAFSAIYISRLALDIVEHDVVLVGKPISHAGGLQTQLMPALSVGATVILTMKPSPAEAIALINQHHVTEYGMLASDLLDFIEYLEQNPDPLASLNNGIGSGDAVPVELHHRFRDLLNWEILEGCGMTEVGCYYAMNPRYGLRKWGSMGKPCPETQIAIINEQGDRVPQGESGEIIVKTPSATIGYWQDAENTQHLFHQGWLYTGDLAYQDEQGYLWFVGRKKLMIIRRGSNIAPVEVENIIDEHPEVHASVVVGITDHSDGQVPVAFVVALHDNSSLTAAELDSYTKSRLAAYKTPVQYLFLSELPRNATGKFDRHHLEELAVEMLK